MPVQSPFRVTGATLDVLTVLLEGGEDLTGLGIAKRARRMSGSVTVVLMRLERAGWVTSDWEAGTVEGRDWPRRRFYALAPMHAASARALVARRRRLGRWWRG